MNMLQYPIVRVGIGAAAVVAGLLGSWSYLDAQREAAERSTQDAAQTVETARQIGQLKGQSAIAGSREMASDELTRVIEHASREAGIAPASLVRISPEPASRMGTSAMKQALMEVSLTQVSMRQLITFLHGLSTGRPPLQVRSIHLTAPPDQVQNENWAAELTLAHLVYSPAGSPSDR